MDPMIANWIADTREMRMENAAQELKKAEAIKREVSGMLLCAQLLFVMGAALVIGFVGGVLVRCF